MPFGLKRARPVAESEARRGERQSLSVPATILLGAGETCEVTIENLSTTGFGAVGAVDLAVGTVFRIGLTPGHARHARVVWRDPGRLGCEFLAPLTPDFATAAGVDLA